jgi:drug/metabolite transporter (DMT)-like permease
MTKLASHRNPGILAALLAAALFGGATPLAKLLLAGIDPWLLAALFYLGSGLGLLLWRRLRRTPAAALAVGDWPWLAGAIASGGVLAPVLLMVGLRHMPASGASLLLNAETVFTVLIAWAVFRENIGARIALGLLSIVGGALLLAWPHEASFAGIGPTLAVLGACLAWGLDNNLTRRVSLNDATWITSAKGLVAGSVNLAIALYLGATWPALPFVLGAGAVGFVAYGVSLTLYVVGLRHLGTARAGAYFSVAPFFGAALALALLAEPITPRLLLAAAAMGLGVWLHLTERHQHTHAHEPMEHEHIHVHDEHHRHAHGAGVATEEPHRHWHSHEPVAHSHAHFPDAHHRHDHGAGG